MRGYIRHLQKQEFKRTCYVDIIASYVQTLGNRISHLEELHESTLKTEVENFFNICLYQMVIKEQVRILHNTQKNYLEIKECLLSPNKHKLTISKKVLKNVLEQILISFRENNESLAYMYVLEFLAYLNFKLDDIYIIEEQYNEETNTNSTLQLHIYYSKHHNSEL